ncbi:hypothetical protein ABZ896_33600 [Streptomyces sp. NPDC047072]|uniref:hypothetical protein n=1 Tax=Streptomyces sp. NPDC047072 TaxID=3154809 RepID=UPI00340BEE0E
MGSLRLTLCAAVLAALAPLTLTSASAAGGASVSVTPSSPTPGTDLALRVSGCPARTATATSQAFVTTAYLTESAIGTEPTLSGETRTPTSLTPGSYPVTITCADTELKTTVTVAPTGTHPATPATPSTLATPSTPASPVAPVNAGGGGTTTHLSTLTPRATGPGTAHAVTGLLLAGAAATAVALRSGRRSRETR